jgi:hypothetical protein
LRSDDELLSHIRQQAGVRRQRRQRAIAAGSAAAVVLLLGAGALAATAGDDHEGVTADGGGTTTTEATTTTTTTTVPTTEETTTSTTTTTTTAPPPETTTTTEAPTTTTTEPPTTTTRPPIAPVTQSASTDGLTVTFTTYRDRARPGWVRIDARFVAARGSGAWMLIDWVGGGESNVYGDVPFGFGDRECYDTDLPADPDAGPLDVTLTAEHDFEGPTEGFVEPEVGVSHCTRDARTVSHRIDLPPVG